MQRMSKALALGMAGLMLVASAPVAPMAQMSPAVRVATTAPQQQQRTPAPSLAISHREESERVADLFYVPRRRAHSDPKNRTAGDRAHKRMKRRRSSGRA